MFADLKNTHNLTIILILTIIKGELFVKTILVLLAAFWGCFCMPVNAGKLHIISATYGVGNIQLDVTNRLKLIYATHGGKFINFKVGKILFDKDPAYGVRKVLILAYKDGYHYKTCSYADGARVLIVPGVRLTKDFSLGKVYYGAKNSWIDVTNKVAQSIKTRVPFKASNNNFRGDPCKQVRKHLCIFYSENNQLKFKTIKENREFNPDIFSAKK